jgi:hypothetical protein
MDFDFDAGAIPRWWFMGNPFVTHFSNGLHLVFPEGERFFIRSVKHYLHQIDDDPVLLERVRGFFAQEARHGHEHAESFAMLERQGYDVRRFLDFYENKALPRLEKLFPPAMRLSVTVALEHLTATMGESALTEDFLDEAHPVMQSLLRWHAAEEIEHKSVAFDVFERVDGRLSVRVAGMVIGLAGLLVFWNLGARMLIAQERGISRADRRRFREQAVSFRPGHTRKLLSRAFFDYVRPGFHPDRRDNYHLARNYLESIGRLAA